jgi:hypothetical protein
LIRKTELLFFFSGNQKLQEVGVGRDKRQYSLHKNVYIVSLLPPKYYHQGIFLLKTQKENMVIHICLLRRMRNEGLLEPMCSKLARVIQPDLVSKQKNIKPGMMVHACNSSIWETLKKKDCKFEVRLCQKTNQKRGRSYNKSTFNRVNTN